MLKSEATKWGEEYDKAGIPSSFRQEPSGTVSKFFWSFWKETGRVAGNQNITVLDAGCGKGRNAIFFAEKPNFEVWALDIVPTNIKQIQEYAAANNLTVHAICQDITEPLPVANKSVDILIDIFCYKHQVDDERRELYRKEQLRVLKDDGYLLLSLAGKDDGYYGQFLKPETVDKIVDPAIDISSVLFDPSDIKREFSGMRIKRFQTIRKEGLMHGDNYMRVTHAFIFQKDLPQNASEADAEVTQKKIFSM